MKARKTKDQQQQLQLSRIQQGWLMIALAAVCLPIWLYLPWWVFALCAFSLAWRVRLLWHGSVQPSRKMTAALAILSFVIVMFEWRPPIGLEPMSSLLIICCALKFLEMRVIREARTVLFLCYFIAAIQLIFEQAILHFFVALGGIILTLTAQNMSERDPWQQYSFSSFSLFPLKSIGWIALVSIPLTVIIFIFAPRMPSFWMIPVESDQARTGVSDTMTPGSIGELTRSGDLAFRVGFAGDIPARSDLYWRALVLSDYDGQSWSNRENFTMIQDGGRTYWPGTRFSPDTWVEEITYSGTPLVYDVYQEPSGQPWLFAIAAPRSTEVGIGLTKGLRLVSRQPVTQRIKYRVRSYPDYSMSDAMLGGLDRTRNLRLPEDFNPRTLELAELWASEGLSPEEIINRLFLQFNREYTYTLDPGTYGTDSIDEFLFDRKRGFCEHFAQATVFLLRAAGVPARIVTGYQGGEVNPEGNYLLVYQYDAHAWAEYWVEGRGWVQADPTAAVSPARIEYGARELFQEEPEFLSDDVFSLAAMQENDLINWLRLRMDSINYLWVSWVLGYDNNKQIDFLQGLFGQISYKTILVVLGSGAAGVILFIYAYMYWNSASRKRPLVQKQFDRFREQLIKSGVDLKPGYTPSRLAQICEQQKIEGIEKVRELCELFERHLYMDIDEASAIKDILKKW